MNRYRWPTRWVLYGLMVMLLFAQAALPVSMAWHQAIELGVVGTTLGAHGLWRRRNAAALEDERILQDIAKRAAARRQTPLTRVQARYLLAQARRTQAPDTSATSSTLFHRPHRR